MSNDFTSDGRPRCASVHREGKRSWRCERAADHVFRRGGFDHMSIAGGRRW